MKTALRSLSFPAGILLAILAAGCGSDSLTGVSFTGPGGPRAGSGAATVQGSVVGGATAPSVSAQSVPVGGLKVSVVGTSLTTTTDASGRFTLRGVPSGRATLRFQGQGTDAHVPVSVAPGGSVTLVVRVSGSHAQVIENEIEFAGPVDSVSPPSLVVSGLTVVTDASTEIRRGHDEITLDQLVVGERVEVEGTLDADGTVLAREIEAEEADDDEGEEIEFEGAVESLAPPSLVVAGRTVLTDADTKFKGDIDSLADLQVGDHVEVEGLLNPDGTVLARKIEREADEEGDDEDDGDDDEDEDEDDDDEDNDEEDDDDDED